MAARYNPETGASSNLVERSFRIDCGGVSHAFTLVMPLYVAEALRDDDWQHVAHRMREQARLLEQRDFTPERIHSALEDTAKDATYARFEDAQRRAGNEAWQVPPTLRGMEYAR